MFGQGSIERKIGVGISVLLGFLLVGALFFHNVEHWSWVDSTYFSVVTLSTIGYGDLAPKQDITKIFIIFYIILGVSAVLYVFTTIGAYYMEQHDNFMQRTIRDVKINRERLEHTTRKLNQAREEFGKEVVSATMKGRKNLKKAREKIKKDLAKQQN